MRASAGSLPAAIGSQGSRSFSNSGPPLVVIGDTPYDADAPGKVGLRMIGVRSGGFSDADLRGAGCAAIYDDPADLLAHYDAFLKDASRT